ncbi:MAG: YicC/YloC family endoribonuclease [Candidatus Merdivicinus sp.]|jgi:uncharacterized protein (TIGR00255 family)
MHMLRSMTGYGRGQGSGGGFDIAVDLKSVNHRYFEFAAKLPKSFLFLEERLKGLVQPSVSRGKVEITVTANSANGGDVEVVVNEAAAQNYISALRKMRVPLDLQDDLKLSHLLRFPDIFMVKRAELDEDAIWQAVSGAAEAALESFQSMRETEGARLKADLLDKTRRVSELVTQVEEKAPALRADYYSRLYQKLAEVLEDKNIEESRLVAEAAIFADKVAVDEETVRLQSHLHQFGDFLENGGPIGKKLDFLVQEMNREANTIGSKAQNLEIARVVVEMKAEIEKIREQIQNIE